MELGQLRLELTDEGGEVGAELPADGTKLQDVQAALAGLDLADERLEPPEAGSEVDLAKTSVLAKLAEEGEHDGVLGAVDRFRHGTSRDPDFGYPKTVYPIMGYTLSVEAGIARGGDSGLTGPDRVLIDEWTLSLEGPRELLDPLAVTAVDQVTTALFLVLTDLQVALSTSCGMPLVLRAED